MTMSDHPSPPRETSPDARPLQLVVTNARIATQDRALHHVGVRDGVIVSISTSDEAPPAAMTQVDAGGRWLIPGAIDTHAHINQRAHDFDHVPGLGPDDNFAGESRSALAGGCTTALNYATFGSRSLLDAYRDGMRAAGEQSRINVLFHGYLMNLDHVAEIEQGVAEGITTFKMFMPYRGEEARNLGGIESLNHAEMRLAFAEIAAYGAQALVHAEDGDIVDACMRRESAAGLSSMAGWERSRPAIAEGDAAWTAMYLAEEAGCPVTIVHVSSLEAMRAREALGGDAAALESCVHYMVLTTESPCGPQGKVAPPVRDAQLAQAITEAVLAGRIDFFGSDHNVWPAATKTEWESAKPGLPGIGLMLPLLLTHLVYTHGMAMERAIELTSRNAALRFGLTGKGVVALGMDADLVVLDEGERTVRLEDLHSAVDYSPYAGMTLRAWPRTTICAGTVVFDDGGFPNDDFRGELLNHRFVESTADSER
jgi:dihydropyrimidinase